MTSSAWLQAPLGAHYVLARPGDWRLWVLNPEAAMLWEFHASGLEAGGMAELLVQRFGLDAGLARGQVEQLIGDWHRSGLLGAAPMVFEDAPENLPLMAIEASPHRTAPDALLLDIAETWVGLCVDDPALRAALEPLVRALHGDRIEPVAQLMHLQGSADDWRLVGQGVELDAGQDLDAALVASLRELVNLACRAEDRLLVVHGAGLALPDGRGLLLIAPGGSGKTTLAAALNAEGYGLLNDDVVPVDADGGLVGLGAPMCLKAGSWPVLATHRPDLAAAPLCQRYGQSIRYLPPRGPKVDTPIPLGLLLFPRYQPGSAAILEPLNPAAALRGLVEAEAVIRDLTQAKLERLARWVSFAPAYALTYPDLESGLALTRQALVASA